MGRIITFLASFCIPVVGLILFIVWRNDRPEDAKIAGILALVGFVLNAVATISLLTVVSPLVL